jgi:hypothetical protein
MGVENECRSLGLVTVAKSAFNGLNSGLYSLPRPAPVAE